MLKKLILLLFLLSLSACGFHLRGQVAMPFSSLYIKTNNPNSPLVYDLRRSLQASQVTLTEGPETAEVILHIASETNEKQILSLGGSGRVTEFNLRYRVSLRAYDNQQNEWIPADEILLRRDYSYDDTRILAKESEEGLLIQSMRKDMAQNILRRLSHAKIQVE